MKKLRILFCALFVLCCGLTFSACKKEVKVDFDISKIYVDQSFIFEYDGMSHAYEVEYDGLTVDVFYALDSAKNDFKSLSELNTKNVGTYNLYYKLSAKGYNSYVSVEPIEITVEPRVFEVSINDYVWMKGSREFDTSYVSYSSSGRIGQDDLGLEFVCPEFDIENANYGDQYELTCSISNPNYILDVTPAKLTVHDYVNVTDKDGVLKTCTSDINSAIEQADAGDIIVLNDNFELNRTIIVDKTITIDGQNHSIFVQRAFIREKHLGEDVATLFLVKDENVVLTLSNIKINNNKTVRAVSAFAGKVVIDGAKISNGNKTDNLRSGGIYLTGTSSLEMNYGSIIGNLSNETDYTDYCADLWVGANANAKLNGGSVGSAFVNANSYSANNPGGLILDGANVENVYVEYDSNNGAKFTYTSGTIGSLKIALKNDNNQYYGTYYKATPVQGETYTGGKLVDFETETLKTGIKYSNNIDSILEDGKNYIFENCEFNAPVSTSKKVGLVFHDCKFTSNTATNLYVTSVSELVVANCTFNGTVTDGYAIDVNLYSAECDVLLIANNKFNTELTSGSSISIKKRLGTTDYPSDDWAYTAEEGKINCEVQILGNDFSDSNNAIEIGTTPQTEQAAANKTTGEFDVLIDANLDKLTVYKKFNDKLNASIKSKSIVEANSKLKLEK